jgi:purine-binding chemotaxis protein CheW
MSDLNKKNDINDEFDFEDSLINRYLTFKIGNENYAIEVINVLEIIGIQKITEVPNIAEYIKGVINLRGIIVPIVSIRKRFSLEEINYSEKTCIIVVNNDNISIGLIVDEVSEVIVIPDSEQSESPQTGKGTQSKHIHKMGKHYEKVFMIIDIHKLLFDILE